MEAMSSRSNLGRRGKPRAMYQQDGKGGIDILVRRGFLSEKNFHMQSTLKLTEKILKEEGPQFDNVVTTLLFTKMKGVLF